MRYQGLYIPKPERRGIFRKIPWAADFSAPALALIIVLGSVAVLGVCGLSIEISVLIDDMENQ